MRYKRVVILFFLGLFFTTNLWAITAPFIDDMESGVNGWTPDYDWIGGPNTPGGPNPPSFTAPPPLVHPSWNKCWGTNLNGKYTAGITSTLTSPQIDVGSGNTPFLSCYLWYKIAAGDYATVEVKTVSSTEWDTLESIPENSNSGGWVKRIYSLGYTGNIQVQFRLVTDSSGGTRDLGLYVDDVAVGTNYDTQNRYIIAIEPEPSPVSTTATSNNMTLRVEVRDLFRYIDNDNSDDDNFLDGVTVTIQAVESNDNNTLNGATSATLFGGKATFTFTDKEKETVTFIPSVTILGQSLTSISTIGKFLSPFRKSWGEKE